MEGRTGTGTSAEVGMSGDRTRTPEDTASSAPGDASSVLVEAS